MEFNFLQKKIAIKKMEIPRKVRSNYFKSHSQEIYD